MMAVKSLAFISFCELILLSGWIVPGTRSCILVDIQLSLLKKFKVSVLHGIFCLPSA